MCGIVCVVTDKNNGFVSNQTDAVESLMYLNQLRGFDSTGLFTVDNKKAYHWLKKVGGWPQLKMDAGYHKVKSSLIKEGLVYVGHGRSATKGSVNIDNAHPFEEEKSNKKGHIVLVHNGTLASAYFQDLPGYNKFKVDSNWIAHCFAEYGAEEALSKIDGAMALIWWDSELETLNFFRNKERPLWYGTTDSGALYVQSEECSLHYINVKHSLGITKFGQFEDNKLYTLTHAKMGPMKEDWEVREIRRAPKSSPPIHQRYNGWFGEDNDRLRMYYEGLYGVSEDAWAGSARRVIDVEDGADNKETARSALTREDQNNLCRSFEDDVYYLRRGDIDEIRWENGRRYTTFEQCVEGRWVQIEAESYPYDEFLWRMYRTPDARIMMSYMKDGRVSYVEMSAEEIEAKLAARDATDGVDDIDEDKNDAEDLVIDEKEKVRIPVKERNWKKGKVVRWHSRHMNKTVKHVAKIDDPLAKTFSEYENELDGKFKIGDEIVLEISEVQELSNVANSIQHVYKVYGQVAKPVQDIYTDVFCHIVSSMSKEEIKNVGFYHGKIMVIGVASTKRHALSGAVIEILMHGAVPAVSVDSTKEKKNGTVH